MHEYTSNSTSCRNPIGIGKSTAHDARDGEDDELQGVSKGVAAPYFAMIDTVMGREYGERKVVKVRCRSGTQRAYFFQYISPCSYRVPYPALSG
jgi:hypothetical protein